MSISNSMDPQDATAYDGETSWEEDILTALRLMGYDPAEADAVMVNHLGDRDEDESIARAYDDAYASAVESVKSWG